MHGAGESDVCTGPRIGRYRGDADGAVASSARSNRTACRAPSPPGETPARLRPRSLAWSTTPASACPWSRPVPRTRW